MKLGGEFGDNDSSVLSHFVKPDDPTHAFRRRRLPPAVLYVDCTCLKVTPTTSTTGCCWATTTRQKCIFWSFLAYIKSLNTKMFPFALSSNLSFKLSLLVLKDSKTKN